MEQIEAAMAQAERKAWDSLSRYKLLMFGYHAANWVTLRKLLPRENGARLPANPFRELVLIARERR